MLKSQFFSELFTYLILLGFFANKEQITLRGRGQSYKVWGKLASVQFFAEIAKLPRNNNFCDQSGQILSQIGDDCP
jgi:hypothetical protein